MELGMDPRFDLSHAYWVVAGIAGVDPADASIGSAAWAEYLVDGDLAQPPEDLLEDAIHLAHGLLARGSHHDEPKTDRLVHDQELIMPLAFWRSRDGRQILCKVCFGIVFLAPAGEDHDDNEDEDDPGPASVDEQLVVTPRDRQVG